MNQLIDNAYFSLESAYTETLNIGISLIQKQKLKLYSEIETYNDQLHHILHSLTHTHTAHTHSLSLNIHHSLYWTFQMMIRKRFFFESTAYCWNQKKRTESVGKRTSKFESNFAIALVYTTRLLGFNLNFTLSSAYHSHSHSWRECTCNVLNSFWMIYFKFSNLSLHYSRLKCFFLSEQRRNSLLTHWTSLFDPIFS
jgi:hypothetical protein